MCSHAKKIKAFCLKHELPFELGECRRGYEKNVCARITTPKLEVTFYHPSKCMYIMGTDSYFYSFKMIDKKSGDIIGLAKSHPDLEKMLKTILHNLTV